MRGKVHVFRDRMAALAIPRDSARGDVRYRHSPTSALTIEGVGGDERMQHETADSERFLSKSNLTLLVVSALVLDHSPATAP